MGCWGASGPPVAQSLARHSQVSMGSNMIPPGTSYCTPGSDHERHPSWLCLGLGRSSRVPPLLQAPPGSLPILHVKTQRLSWAHKCLPDSLPSLKGTFLILRSLS